MQWVLEKKNENKIIKEKKDPVCINQSLIDFYIVQFEYSVTEKLLNLSECIFVAKQKYVNSTEAFPYNGIIFNLLKSQKLRKVFELNLK